MSGFLRFRWRNVLCLYLLDFGLGLVEWILKTVIRGRVSSLTLSEKTGVSCFGYLHGKWNRRSKFKFQTCLLRSISPNYFLGKPKSISSLHFLSLSLSSWIATSLKKEKLWMPNRREYNGKIVTISLGNSQVIKRNLWSTTLNFGFVVISYSCFCYCLDIYLASWVIQESIVLLFRYYIVLPYLRMHMIQLDVPAVNTLLCFYNVKMRF